MEGEAGLQIWGLRMVGLGVQGYAQRDSAVRSIDDCNRMNQAAAEALTRAVRNGQ